MTQSFLHFRQSSRSVFYPQLLRALSGRSVRPTMIPLDVRLEFREEGLVHSSSVIAFAHRPHQGFARPKRQLGTLNAVEKRSVRLRKGSACFGPFEGSLSLSSNVYRFSVVEQHGTGCRRSRGGARSFEGGLHPRPRQGRIRSCPQPSGVGPNAFSKYPAQASTTAIVEAPCSTTY